MAMRWLGAGVLAASFSAAAANLAVPPAPLTAAEIVEKNMAARGGVEAWRRIQTMVWVGKVGNAAGATPPMPFVLELKRPNKTHFEINALEQKFVRFFDGTHGWKVRPVRGGGPETQPFSQPEVNFARDEFVIDGPLIDYQAKGVAISLGGIDEVEGRRAYRLEIKLPSGARRRVWIDADNFLDLRSDRPASNPLSKSATVSVFYRDYRTIEGLQIPLTIESSVAAGTASERLVIDKVSLNPTLPDRNFAVPSTPRSRRAIVRVDGDSATMVSGPGRPSP